MTEQELIAILVALHEAAAERIRDRILAGARSVAEIDDILRETLAEERTAIGDYLDQFGDDDIIDRKWNAGKNYRDSLSESMERTREDLEAIFEEGMEDLDKEAQEAFLRRRGYETETISITEETRIRAMMVANYYPYYEYLTEGDIKVCPICAPLNGIVFDTVDARVGYTLPPMHPRCRCRIKPVN